MKRLTSVVILLAATIFVATQRVGKASDPTGLVVHEWGTFTSIAGEDGRAVRWLPQAGPTDLPCFVERITSNLKGDLAGTVRMETPVIYFYAPRDMSVNVSVRFRQGVLTEWYPRPAVSSLSAGSTAAVHRSALEGTLAWANVKVLPGAATEFPVERQSNHYYVARQTDASPVQSGSEKERFLFYRGVGRLPPSISAITAAGGKIIIRDSRGDALGDLMLFENRDGNIGYEVRHVATAHATFDPKTSLDLDDESASGHLDQAAAFGSPSPQNELERMLVAHGLYRKEAKAMVESWRDSWFEQGTRLFYIVSGQAIDAILPLEIHPEPTKVVRVFVGRMELITPATMREVNEAIAKSDWVTLARYGRFLQPIAERLLTASTTEERRRIERRLQPIYASLSTPASGCN
jgi:hypothetical protein